MNRHYHLLKLSFFDSFVLLLFFATLSSLSSTFPAFYADQVDAFMCLQVVIIDEAHNLSDTLSCIHSAELSGAQVKTLVH